MPDRFLKYRCPACVRYPWPFYGGITKETLSFIARLVPTKQWPVDFRTRRSKNYTRIYVIQLIGVQELSDTWFSRFRAGFSWRRILARPEYNRPILVLNVYAQISDRGALQFLRWRSKSFPFHAFVIDVINRSINLKCTYSDVQIYAFVDQAASWPTFRDVCALHMEWF